MQRRNADGRLRRLVWYYEGDPAAGNYTIEELNSQPDGTWTTAALLEYAGGKLARGRFYSGENLIEERRYEYTSAGVIKEYISKASEQYPSILKFKRPDESTVEAYELLPDGTEDLVARLRYDGEGRLVFEERVAKGKLNTRDVYAYNAMGKLADHVSYDYRDLPVRHVLYGYTGDGLPQSVVHLDVKGRVVFGLTYTREYDGENVKTTVTDGHGEVTGTIEYRRANGRDVSRTEVMFLGDGELRIVYAEFDEKGNWLRKETETYKGNSLKSRTVTNRLISYFD